MNRNVLPLIQSVLKVRCIVLLFSFLSCAEEKFAGRIWYYRGKVVSAVDFKPMAMLKCSQTPILALCLLTNRVSL
jgi:hypothetical protein